MSFYTCQVVSMCLHTESKVWAVLCCMLRACTRTIPRIDTESKVLMDFSIREQGGCVWGASLSHASSLHEKGAADRHGKQGVWGLGFSAACFEPAREQCHG